MNEKSRPIWWHTISIAVPHNRDPEMAGACFLAIDGGFNEIDVSYFELFRINFSPTQSEFNFKRGKLILHNFQLFRLFPNFN